MRNQIRSSGLLLVLICAISISACTSISTVKEVTSDPAAYLSKKFTTGSISPNVAKKIPVGTTRSGPGRFVLIAQANYESSDGKKESWKNTITLVDLGQGVFQRTSELSNNDIPYKVNYSLSYKGIMDIRWQSVPLRGSVTEPLYEVKDVVRFDPLPISENQDFVFDYLSGNEVQVANFLSAKKSCKTTRLLAANELNKKLVGGGLEIECQQFANNVVQSRSKWVYLQYYGFAVQTEQTGSAYKTLVKFIDVGDQ